jgi:hypothetical protein
MHNQRIVSMQIKNTIKIKPLIFISILIFILTLLYLVLFFDTGLKFAVKFGENPPYQINILPHHNNQAVE